MLHLARRHGLLLGLTAASLGIVYGYDLSNIAGALLFSTGVFLTMLHSLGGAGTFGLFGVLAVAGFGFVYRFVPETKGRQLEEIRHFWANDGRWPDELLSAATDVQECH